MLQNERQDVVFCRPMAVVKPLVQKNRGLPLRLQPIRALGRRFCNRQFWPRCVSPHYGIVSHRPGANNKRLRCAPSPHAAPHSFSYVAWIPAQHSTTRLPLSLTRIMCHVPKRQVQTEPEKRLRKTQDRENPVSTAQRTIYIDNFILTGFFLPSPSRKKKRGVIGNQPTMIQ